MKKIVLLFFVVSLFGCRKFDKVSNEFEFKLADESLYKITDAIKENSNEGAIKTLNSFNYDMSRFLKVWSEITIPEKHIVISHKIEGSQEITTMRWTRENDFNDEKNRMEMIFEKNLNKYIYSVNFLKGDHSLNFEGQENLNQTEGSFSQNSHFDYGTERFYWNIDSLDNSFIEYSNINNNGYTEFNMKIFPDGSGFHKHEASIVGTFFYFKSDWNSSGSGSLQELDWDDSVLNEEFF